MRGLGLPVYLLCFLVIGMAALFLPGIMRPASDKGLGKPTLSGEQRRALDQAEKALLEQRLSEAKQLLDPLRSFQDLRVRLLLAELDGYANPLPADRLAIMEKEVRADRGLSSVFHLARVAELSGDLPRAKSFLQELASTSYLAPDLQVPVQIRLASISAALGDHPLAIKISQGILLTQPGNEEMFQLFLRSLRASKGRVKPDLLLDIADHQHASHLECQSLLTAYLFDAGLKDEGIRRLERCLKLSPNDTSILSQLYVRYRQSKQWDRALDAFQRCLELGHAFPKQAQVAKAAFEAAREASTLGRSKQAFLFLRFALLRDRSLLEGGGEDTFTAISNLIQGEGNAEEKAVLAIFWRFMNGEPREALSAAQKIGPSLKDQVLARDIGVIQKACQGVLSGDEAYKKYLQDLEGARQPTRPVPTTPAVPVASETTTAKPLVASAPVSKPPEEEMPALTGNPRIDNILTEAKSFSHDAGRQRQAADNLVLLQAWELAERLMKRLSERDPADWQARYRLGVIAWHFQRFEEATDHLQETIRLKPDDAKARAKLARVLAQRGDFPQALEEAKTAIAKDPNSSEAHLVMAQVLFNRGRPDEALEEVNKGLAVEFDSTSETFLSLNQLRDEAGRKR